MSQDCSSCAEHQNKPTKAPIHPWMVPEKPWSQIHVDHAINFMGSNWLVFVDAYSKYLCVHPTTSTSSKATMDLLEQDFVIPTPSLPPMPPLLPQRNFKSGVDAEELRTSREHHATLQNPYTANPSRCHGQGRQRGTKRRGTEQRHDHTMGPGNYSSTKVPKQGQKTGSKTGPVKTEHPYYKLAKALIN